MFFLKTSRYKKRGFDLFQVGVAVVVGLMIWVGGMRIYTQVSNSAEARLTTDEMFMIGFEIRNYYRDAGSYKDIVNEHNLASTNFGLASGIPSSVLDKYETDGVGNDYFTLDRPNLSLSLCQRLMNNYYGEGTALRCSKSGSSYKFRVTFTDP
jgi:hypothetical protein